MCVLPLNSENNTVTIQLDLIVATAADLKEIDFYKPLPNDEFKAVYKRRMHLPFWLKSFKTNIVENKCYFINEHTKMDDILLFLKEDRVFIHKDFKVQ
ncbi:hypothetical protein [Tenacibaculum ovolyticum]|uniref:hypothetical protein n=1 Tax=Tenacibaculum ovolyticum TaxID=104270 RepID=UPI0007ED2DC5|nr:hypothetical protein [Tenacibaculum ovolyticum]